MSDLSLRAYHRKIDNWIEENEIDKAITQSEYLIQSFPKSIQSWRCLSKALLQKQDFELADQVFDVILRVDPDDFIAHIGKSMSAELRGELDSSIEHMRRAFELQPGNEGLESEIKRLLNKKDGQAPEKIHLTRGALIKMYLRGSLYEQAIAEALIGNRENPQRMDFQLALAEGYEKSGIYAKAVEICVNILKELPYCQKANEILQHILAMSGNKDIPQTYKRRLIEMDPYYAYLEADTTSVLDVPDIAVMVEDKSDQELEGKPISSLIQESWINKAESEIEYKTSDWKDIVENALEATEPGLKFDLASFDEVSEEEMGKANSSETHHSLSKKDTFLGRLRPSAPKNDFIETKPDWTFDQTGELVFQSSAEDPESVEGHDHPIILNNIEIGESLIDFETPIFTDPNGEESVESGWITELEHAESDDMNEDKKKLADTQEIKVVDYQPAYMLDIAEKAIIGENFKFAFATYRHLIDQEGQIDEVIKRIEEISKENPEKVELLLFLGELYTLKGKRPDALAAYKKAQKNISL